MGKESGPKIKTKEEQEQERIKEIIEMGEKLNLITDKAINAGLKIENLSSKEYVRCACGDRDCKPESLSFDAFKDKRVNDIVFSGEQFYCRLSGDYKKGIRTYLRENISLNKDRVVYYQEEYSDANPWGGRQKFSFTENNAKDESSSLEPRNYRDGGPPKLSMEEAEKKVHALLSNLLEQMDDIVQKAKKELE
jgi:hypothetical protein